MVEVSPINYFFIFVFFSSSGDDINISARGNVKQKKCLQKKKKLEVDEESSSEDEFEKEMARELNQTMRAIETSAGGIQLD